MKRWYLLTVVLYFLVLSFLWGPLYILSWVGEPTNNPLKEDSWINLVFIGFGEFMPWINLGLAFLCGLLLFVPIDVVRSKRVPKGGWISLAVASGGAAAVLALGAVATWVELFSKLTVVLVEPIYLYIGGGVTWAVWGWVFWRYTQEGQGDATAFRRTIDALYKGSILDLLIAVPSHVFVRGKEYCCAGMSTFFGIMCGLSVMLLAYGPGVFFLFADRARKLRRGHDKKSVVQADEAPSPYSRDGLLWAGMALAAMPVPLVGMGVEDPKISTVLFSLGADVFVVLACNAFRHGVRAKMHREPKALTCLLLTGLMFKMALALIVMATLF